MQSNDKTGGRESAPKVPTTPATNAPGAPSGGRGKVQGEGDYDAARRHRESATEFVRSHDIEAEARDATPGTPEEARELLEAERKGQERTRGEDRRDVMRQAGSDAPEERNDN
jgi:hypothetical protein